MSETKGTYEVLDAHKEYFASPATRKGDKVIQRNGISFMWPEVEE